MRFVCLATGNLYTWTSDWNKAIALCKNFEIDGVEIMLRDLNRLNQFQPTKETIKYLKKQEFNTIHAPLVKITYNKNAKTKKVINKIEYIYNKIDAKNVVFHPYNIEDTYYLNKSNMTVSIENISKLTTIKKVSIKEIESVLNQNPNWGFVLDVCHAATYSLKKIREYIDKLGSRIKEVHLSYFKDGVEHIPIHQCDKQYFKAIKPIKKLDTPLVIESHSYKKRFDIYQKDIEFIRKNLIK